MRVLKTIFTLLAGAILGIIAFVTVIFKVSKKVANVMDLPEFIVNSVKDMVVSFVSELLYADKDALKVRSVDRSYKSYRKYRGYRDDSSYLSKYMQAFTFNTYDEALLFCNDVNDAYQTYGRVTVEDVRNMAETEYQHYIILYEDAYYGWTGDVFFDDMVNLTPNKVRAGWSVTLPKPVKLDQEAW